MALHAIRQYEEPEEVLEPLLPLLPDFDPPFEQFFGGAQIGYKHRRRDPEQAWVEIPINRHYWLVGHGYRIRTRRKAARLQKNGIGVRLLFYCPDHNPAWPGVDGLCRGCLIDLAEEIAYEPLGRRPAWL